MARPTQPLQSIYDLSKHGHAAVDDRQAKIQKYIHPFEFSPSVGNDTAQGSNMSTGVLVAGCDFLVAKITEEPGSKGNGGERWRLGDHSVGFSQRK